MTVKAELQFVTDAATEANKAADGVARFRSELQSLQSMSGSGAVGPKIGTVNGATAQASQAIALQIQGANQVAAIRAKAVADEASSQHRIAEQYQKDRNAILVAGANASHAQMASELAHTHRIAELEKKSAAEANKLRVKGEEDRARIAAKAIADEARDARKVALRQTPGGTSKLGGALEQLITGGGVQGAAGQLGGRAQVVVAIGTAAVAAAAKVADLSVEFGKAVVGAQSYREDIKEAFVTVKGTNELADATFRTAIRNADKLGFKRAESVGQFLDLATKGFDDAKIQEIQGRLLDITTIDPSASMEGLTKVIGKIKATGRLNQESLNELSTFGLEQADVIKVIGKALGKSDAEVLKTLSSAGGLRDARNVDFVLSAIAGQTGGGEAGAKYAEKANRNLSSLISRIEDIPANILFDVEAGPGINSIKETMKQIIGYFDVGSETGQRVRKVVGDLFNALSEGLFGKRQGDEKGVTGTLNNIVAIAESAVPIVRELSGEVGSLIRAFLALGSGDTTGLDASTKRIVGIVNVITGIQGAIFDVFTGKIPSIGKIIQGIFDVAGIDVDTTKVTKWIDGISDLLSPRTWLRMAYDGATGGDVAGSNPILQYIQSAINGASDAAVSGAMQLGTDIINGLIGGISAGLSSVASMAVSMGDTVISSVRGALDSHSPARELISVGLDSAIGLAIGGRRGTPLVAGAFSSMAMSGLMAAASVQPLPMSMPTGLLSPGQSSFAGMSSGAPIQFTFAPVITVQVAGDGDANEIASTIEREVRKLLPMLTPELITAYIQRMAGIQ